MRFIERVCQAAQTGFDSDQFTPEISADGLAILD
jgi:hypothetical protein